MKNNNQLIKSFYEQLDEELENFSLSADKLIASYEFIEYEYLNGDIVGIAGIREGHSFFISIKKDYQSRGIGQKLLKKVIERAKNNNYSYIKLSVAKHNKSAAYIYKKYGFNIISSMLVDGKDCYYMIKPLSLKGKFFMLRERLKMLLINIILSWKT